MVQIERHDSILVKIVDEEDHMISNYYTTAMNETLHMFITAKENEINCYFNEYSSVIPDKYQHMEYLIKDVYLCLGSKEDIPVIEVVI